MRLRNRKKEKRHTWTEDDDIVTLYLHKFGDNDLPFSVEDIGQKMGMGVGSLKMRIANFKAIDGKGGLDHFGTQSMKIYKRYKQTPKDELKSLVLRALRVSTDASRGLEEKMAGLTYNRIRRNIWTKGKKTVRIVHSTEFGKNHIRISWKDEWKDDFAIIYDYSAAGGPVCVVPVQELFVSKFVREKRKQKSYANSGYWWSQKFPMDHELAKLILRFKDRWTSLV